MIYKVTEDEDKKSWRTWRLFRHFHVNITPEETHLHSPHYISLGSSFFDSLSKKGPIKMGQPRTISLHGNDVNCSLKSACWRWKWHKKWSAGASEEQYMCNAYVRCDERMAMIEKCVLRARKSRWDWFSLAVRKENVATTPSTVAISKTIAFFFWFQR